MMSPTRMLNTSSHYVIRNMIDVRKNVNFILSALKYHCLNCTIYLKTVVCAISAPEHNMLLYIPLSAFFTKCCLCTHSNINNTLYATNLFQIPIVVVSPGPEPVTRSQRMTMIDSGHELKLHPDDFQNFERQSYPVVIAWNGHNHFCSNLCYVKYAAQPIETEAANHFNRGQLEGYN